MKECPDCKKRIFKSIKNLGKFYCSKCRKYFE